MKKLIAILALSVLAMQTSIAAAEVRIGFVNTEQVLKQAPQASQASEKLKSEFAPRDASIVSEQKKLKGLEEKLSKNADIMSEDERRKLERDIVAAQRDLKRARDEFTEDFNIRRNEEFAKLQRTVASAIVELAKSEKFDLIFESGVVFAGPKVDITQKVLDRLNSMGK